MLLRLRGAGYKYPAKTQKVIKMARTKGNRKKRIYGEVKTLKDIRDIFAKIRSDIRKAKSRERLTELYRRAGYIITLTHSPAWRKAFRGKIRRMRAVAKEEFTKTANAINKKADRLGIRDSYDTKWG